jgi:hypothetical protein
MNGKAEPMLTAIEGVDSENPGSTLNRSGKPIPVPGITGKIRRFARCGIWENASNGARGRYRAPGAA